MTEFKHDPYAKDRPDNPVDGLLRMDRRQCRGPQPSLDDLPGLLEAAKGVSHGVTATSDLQQSIRARCPRCTPSKLPMVATQPRCSLRKLWRPRMTCILLTFNEITRSSNASSESLIVIVKLIVSVVDASTVVGSTDTAVMTGAVVDPI